MGAFNRLYLDSKEPIISNFNVHEKYLTWLLSLLNITGAKRHNIYRDIVRQLDKIMFIYSVDFDENRMLDGFKLREDFYFKEKIDINMESSLSTNPVSLLEVLVAISIKMEEFMSGAPYSNEEYHPYVFFREMLINTGLYGLAERGRWDLFSNIAYNVMLRNYGSDGSGGLFPLINTREDQRNVEIWYQMQAYMLENYYPNL